MNNDDLKQLTSWLREIVTEQRATNTRLSRIEQLLQEIREAASKA